MITIRIHAVTAAVAMILIGSFLTATVVSELLGADDDIRRVKSLVVLGLGVLVPSIAVTGATGRALATRRTSPMIRRKLRRTAMVALTGLFALVPCALMLNYLARAGEFGTKFTVLQLLEIAAGLSNLLLLIRNARDGRRLSAGRRQRQHPAELAPMPHGR